MIIVLQCGHECESYDTHQQRPICPTCGEVRLVDYYKMTCEDCGVAIIGRHKTKKVCDVCLKRRKIENRKGYKRRRAKASTIVHTVDRSDCARRQYCLDPRRGKLIKNKNACHGCGWYRKGEIKLDVMDFVIARDSIGQLVYGDGMRI